jgi:hypothetical protein
VRNSGNQLTIVIEVKLGDARIMRLKWRDQKNDSAGRLQNPTFGYCGLSDDTPQISRVIIIHFPHQVWPYSIFIGCIFQTNPVGYG